MHYQEGQTIPVGYHPVNNFYVRNLRDNRPPETSFYFWIVPFLLMVWFFFVALFRHHERQVEIWEAAEAADADE